MHPKLTETLSKYKKIILVGWGTGGHIQPILSLTEDLRDKELLWIWGKDSNEEFEAKKKNIPFKSIPTLKLRTTNSPEIFLYPLVLIAWIFEARRILYSVMSTRGDILLKSTKQDSPTSGVLAISLHSKWQKQSHSPWGEGRGEVCIFSKWWPWSVAVGIAGWSLGIPLYIHESDTIPGRSNRILSKFARIIFLGFEGAKKYFNPKKCEVVWQILSRVFDGKMLSPITRNKGEKWWVTWSTNKPHILVICGSQWAKSVFEVIIQEFHWNSEYEWIISLGKLNESMKYDFKEIDNVQALAWISQEDIVSLLRTTDIAITRGSATTLAEIDTFSIRKIIIPLPYSAHNHQFWNAKEYEKNGDILLEQKNLKQLPEIIKKLWQDFQL